MNKEKAHRISFLQSSFIFLCLISFQISGQGWVKSQDMSVPRMNFALVPFNGKIYAFGGEGLYLGNNKPNYLRSVEVYDPPTNHWTGKKDMPQPLSFVRSAVMDNKIYLFGGETIGSDFSSKVFEYNPEEDSYIEKTTMPEGFLLFGALNAVVLDSNIYLQSENHFYLYNPFNNRWDSVTFDRNLPALNCLAVYNNKIISICGGNWGEESNEILEYDSSSNTWNEIFSAPVDVSEHSALVLNDHLYILGGCNGTQQSISNRFNDLNLLANQWTRLPDIPVDLHFPGVAACNGRIYLVGGAEGLYRFSGHQKSVYVFTTDVSSGIDHESAEVSLVYPNPGFGFFQVNYSDLNPWEFELFDDQGWNVFRTYVSDRQLSLYIKRKGLYYYSINKKITGKIINMK